jgi:tetratricopeptide (TPR) repeat protein
MFSRRAMEGAPTNSLVLALMSNMAIMLHGNAQAGIALAKNSVAINPQNAFAYAAMAGSLMLQGSPHEAYSAADKGAKLAARSGYLHWLEMHKGLAAIQMGEFATAVSCFEAARSRAPSFRAPLRQLVFLYLQRGEPERAHRTVLELRRLEPDFSFELALEDPNYPVRTLRLAELLRTSVEV